MNERIPKYENDILNNVHEHFSLHMKDYTDRFLETSNVAHSHNYYIIGILHEGTLSHLADFNHDCVSAPAILLLDVDQVHTHPDMDNCKLTSIAFSPRFIADQNDMFLLKLTQVFSRSFIKIPKDELDQLDEILSILDRYHRKEHREIELIQALLNVFILKCARLSENFPMLETQKSDLYADFRMSLKKNFDKEHHVKFYADLLNVSASILNLAVKKTTSKTPKQLIDEHLVLEAQRLLCWSDISGKEMSWKLGFETDSYFNKFFKKHTGLTPKDFRRKARISS